MTYTAREQQAHRAIQNLSDSFARRARTPSRRKHKVVVSDHRALCAPLSEDEKRRYYELGTQTLKRLGIPF